MAHNNWHAVKRPDAQCWIVHDDIGFAMLTMDRDGWRAKNIAEVLNRGEEAMDAERRKSLRNGIGE